MWFKKKQKLVSISYQEYERIILDKYPDATPITLDEEFTLIPDKKMEKFLWKDNTNGKRYIIKKHECDEFGFDWFVAVKKKFGGDSACGVVIARTHVFNFYLNERKEIKEIEPQTDKVPNGIYEVEYVIS